VNHEPLHERLAAALGDALTPAWRPAFDAVPRHAFIPDVVWIVRDDGPGWVPLSRHDDPGAWWDLVYQDGYVVTQVDDGRAPEPGTAGEYSTSSASQPSLVLRMLDQLDPRPGERVLEVGTGTGYNAALLCHRLGDEQVTTVEVDEQLAERARKSLADAGFHPTVVAGDGLAGWAPGAPYDRVESTASVRQIPPAWIAQTRTGGVILTPWGNGYHNDALLRLTVGDGGTASGRFVGEAAFMWVRSQRVLLGGLKDYVHRDDEPDKARTTLDPREVFGRPDADFAVSTRAPECSWHRFDADDGSGEFTIWLLSTSGDGRSWASVDYEPGGPYLVEQYGPRRLWDEVEAAYRWWISERSPERERFGLTITPQRHELWLDDPRHVIAPG
jgi:methyltransferase of ATP-grasp peptide maturase system